MKNFKWGILILIVGLLIFNYWQTNKFTASPLNNQKTDLPPEEQLKIISTNPNPLDEATILPTQNIEITFNKPIYRSQFKHKLDPDIEHEVEVVNGVDKEFGSTMKIVFKNPLPLGSGYSLFIYGNTTTEDNLPLGSDIVYHFKTIKFRGI